MGAPAADAGRRRGLGAWVGRIAAAALGGYLGYVSIEGSRRLVRPGRRSLEALDGAPASPADIGLAYEDVRFTTDDGVSLSGWLIPAARETRSAVILMHGFAGTRLPDLPEYVPWLQRWHHVLQFDFRGHGASGDAPVALGSLARHDVPAAVRFMESRGFGPMALMGISLGASVGVLAGGDVPVAAVVADAAFAQLHHPIGNRMRLDRYPLAALGSRLIVAAATLRTRDPLVEPVSRVSRIAPRGLLVIAPRDDRLIDYRQSLKLYEAAREPKELYIVDGAGHSYAHAVGGAEYERRVLDFVGRHLEPDVPVGAPAGLPARRRLAADLDEAGEGSFYNAAADRARSNPMLAGEA